MTGITTGSNGSSGPKGLRGSNRKGSPPRQHGLGAVDRWLSHVNSFGHSRETIQKWHTGQGLTVSESKVWQQLHNDLETVTFEGGGAKGLVYLGTYLASKELGLTPKQYIGTSIGAVTALLAAMDVTKEQAEEELTKADFKSFFNPDESTVAKGFRFLRSRAIHSQKPLETWVSGLLEKYAGDPNITFEEFVKKSSEEGRPFAIPGMIVSACRLVETADKKPMLETEAKLCSPTTTPKMRIIDAIKMSTAIPGAYKLRHGRILPDGTFDKSKHPDNWTFCDGGVTYNNPFDYLLTHTIEGKRIAEGPAREAHQARLAHTTLSLVIGNQPEAGHSPPTSTKQLAKSVGSKPSLSAILTDYFKKQKRAEIASVGSVCTLRIDPPAGLESMSHPTAEQKQSAFQAGYNAFWEFVRGSVKRVQEKKTQQLGLQTEIASVATLLDNLVAKHTTTAGASSPITYCPMYETREELTVFVGFQLKFDFALSLPEFNQLKDTLSELYPVKKEELRGLPTKNHPLVVEVKTNIDWGDALQRSAPRAISRTNSNDAENRPSPTGSAYQAGPSPLPHPAIANLQMDSFMLDDPGVGSSEQHAARSASPMEGADDARVPSDGEEQARHLFVSSEHAKGDAFVPESDQNLDDPLAKLDHFGPSFKRLRAERTPSVFYDGKVLGGTYYHSDTETQRSHLGKLAAASARTNSSKAVRVVVVPRREGGSPPLSSPREGGSVPPSPRKGGPA